MIPKWEEWVMFVCNALVGYALSTVNAIVEDAARKKEHVNVTAVTKSMMMIKEI
jgi:hypothetical protein